MFSLFKNEEISVIAISRSIMVTYSDCISLFGSLSNSWQSFEAGDGEQLLHF